MICSNNRFCASLDEETRASLCEACVKHRYAKGAELPQDECETHALLVVDGAIATVKASTGKMQFLCIPADIIGHEYLFNSRKIKYAEFGCLRAFRDAEVAWLPLARLRELFMTNPQFAKAMYMDVSVLDNRKAFYRLMVTLDDAYHAVLYMLLFLKRHGIKNPTHGELAFLCGLNRVTVTRVLGEITKHENYDELREYMESVLESEE